MPAAFRAGAALALPGSVARHVQVLRLQPGAVIALFNGDDGAEWPAEVVHMSRSGVEVRLGAAQSVARELPEAATLAVGVPANDRMDALVEKAGEMGAAAIQPLLCERSVLRLAGERGEAKRRHWSGVAAAASEQCGRTRVTEVLPMRPLFDWLDDLRRDGRATAPRQLVVLSLHAGAAAPAQAIPAAPAVRWPEPALEPGLAPASAPRPAGDARPRIVVLSGPEGGLSGDEERAAVERGFQRLSLGPRVLRADTAPLAVLAWLGLRAAGAVE